MPITLNDQLEEIEDKIEKQFKKSFIRSYRHAEKSKAWAERQVEHERNRQRKIEKVWHKRFGCECGLHGITCTHKKQDE